MSLSVLRSLFTCPPSAFARGIRPADERRRLVRQPPEILITTPESFYLLLTSQARKILHSVETVIIDEIHSLVPTKRGSHLFLSLERLEDLRRRGADPDCQAAVAPLQRIGLSATQRPLEEVARLLAGAEIVQEGPASRLRPRDMKIVDGTEKKQFDIRIEVPVEDMARLGQLEEIDSGPTSGPVTPSIWPRIHPRLLELIRQHRSTIIFANSRRLAERLSTALNELAGEELVLAHHGSVSKETRAAIEDRLKRGELPAIVATSTLELGIDMGAVDLVIQIESPPSIAAGIQRIGRAGHQVGAKSEGVVFPKYRGDLLACSAAVGRMLEGMVEESFYPRNPLDIVAQQLVAMVALEPRSVDDLYDTFRRAAPFHELPRSAFEGVLDLLSGRYPSDQFAALKPRVHWDRLSGTVSARTGAQRVAILNGGTIPDRGLYGVFLADDPDGKRSRVGELDEEMVFETHAGDVFLLGASSWRVTEITQDRVLVIPAPGEPGKMPFWRGDGPGRPLEFGRAIGKLTRELSQGPRAKGEKRLTEHHGLEPRAARNLMNYLQEQVECTEEPPTDQTLIVECFLDEVGDWRVALLSPFGSRVHAPWAMVVSANCVVRPWERSTSSGPTMEWPFDFPKPMNRRIGSRSFPNPTTWRTCWSESSGVRHFSPDISERMPPGPCCCLDNNPENGRPLWLQRRRSADLLAVAAQYADFPLILETYRECLRDVFDLPGLKQILTEVQSGRIRVRMVESRRPSPFASSLLFGYAGTISVRRGCATGRAASSDLGARSRSAPRTSGGGGTA
jgi:ATP-dependent helicase Lhr and Lhr-like helicase